MGTRVVKVTVPAQEFKSWLDGGQQTYRREAYVIEATIEYSEMMVERMIQQAAINKSRKCTSGPITVTVKRNRPAAVKV